MAEAFRERLLSVLSTLQPKPTVQPQVLAQQMPLPVPIPAPPVTAPTPGPFYFSGNPNSVPLNVMYPYSTYVAPSSPTPKIPWHFLCVALLLSGLGLGIAITILVLDQREQKQEKRLVSVK